MVPTIRHDRVMENETKKSGLWRILLGGGFVLALVVAVLLIVRKPPLTIDDPLVRISDPAQDIVDFSLEDYDNKPFTNMDLQGSWTLIFTGFLYCPDICPMTLTDMAAVFKSLKTSGGYVDRLRLVFISVDPFRDTPELIKDYVRYFNPDFLGVTGTPEELKRVAEALHLFYVFNDPDTGDMFNSVLERPELDYYNVMHSTAILLLNPEGKLVARLNPPYETERIAGVLRTILDYYGD